MRVNNGKVIEFSSFRGGKTIVAEIKQVVVDTRVNRIYFRVHELSTGKLYHTSIYNETVVVNEEETARVAEERAAAEKAKSEEKEAKKKAREEKAKAAKEAAPKKEKVSKKKAAKEEVAEEASEETTEEANQD